MYSESHDHNDHKIRLLNTKSILQYASEVVMSDFRRSLNFLVASNGLVELFDATGRTLRFHGKAVEKHCSEGRAA